MSDKDRIELLLREVNELKKIILQLDRSTLKKGTIRNPNYSPWTIDRLYRGADSNEYL